MVSSEERIKVLQMIEEGKIGIEEGAFLLKTLESPETKPRCGRLRRDLKDKRMLRVKVDDTRGGQRKVNVVLPMALVNAGMNIAGKYADGIQSEHTFALIEAIETGKTGKIVEVVDEVAGDHVQVFIE